MSSDLTYRRLYSRAFRIGAAALKEYNETRVKSLLHIQVFARFASTLSTSRSVALLLDSEQYWDATLLCRVMLDNFIDICYILYQPEHSKLFVRLFRIEYAIDRHHDVEALAKIRGCSISQLPNKQFVEGAENDYSKAKNDPVFHARASDWPKRWQSISKDEKLAAIKMAMPAQAQWLDLFKYTVTVLGNSVAHGRAPTLEAFLRPNSSTEWYLPSLDCEIIARAKRHPFMEHIDLEIPLLVLPLAATCAIIDCFHLARFHHAVSRLADEWRSWATSANAQRETR